MHWTCFLPQDTLDNNTFDILATLQIELIATLSTPPSDAPRYIRCRDPAFKAFSQLLSVRVL